MRFFLRYFGLFLLTLQICSAKTYSLPNEIVFAGQNVPLDKYDVKNRLAKTFNVLVNDRRGFTQNLLDKQNYFLPYAKEVLSQYDLHEDLAYIIPVESEFDPRAFSQSQASGLWQLMPTTAKMYGLRADNFVDERNLLEKSTRAAAEHLKMLSQIFKDDPFLVIAAYNNGDSNVRSMIESQKSGGFWESRSNSETEFYVEKVILYKLILSNPEEYGFDSPHKNEERKYEMCTISLGSENLNFSDICSILNISYRELYKINPHIKFGSYKTSGIIGKYTSMDICIPEGSKDKLFSELKNRKLIANSTDGYFEDTIAKIEILEDIYEIKFNDNIESIAFKYGVDWRKLAEKNNLKFVTLSSGVETAETFKGQKLRIIR